MSAVGWSSGALAAAVCVGACQQPPTRGRVMVLGLDGVDPDAVDLLVAEGKLPHFAALRRDGAYGRLRSSKPLLSPILWTTIATGKPPDQHQIGHFVAVNAKTGEQLPVTSRMRKVKALWNIATAAGRSVAVVGWWATWPAEPVTGAVVSDHTCYHFLFDEGVRGGGERSASVYPPTLADRVAALVKRPGDLTPADLAPYVQVDAAAFARPFDFDDPLSHFKWALATAESYRAIAEDLWRTDRPDLLMVVHRRDRLDLAPVRPSVPRPGSGRRAGRSATAVRRRRRGDVRLRRPAGRRARGDDGRRHDARRAVRPRLRARRAAGRSERHARHAPRQRALPPRRRHPLPVRARRDVRARRSPVRRCSTSRRRCWR